MRRYENSLPSPTMIYRREARKLQRVLILGCGCDWHSDYAAAAHSASVATVFMLRAVPVLAAVIFSFDFAMPLP
jgi:hypothetical protein